MKNTIIKIIKATYLGLIIGITAGMLTSFLKGFFYLEPSICNKIDYGVGIMVGYFARGLIIKYFNKEV